MDPKNSSQNPQKKSFYFLCSFFKTVFNFYFRDSETPQAPAPLSNTPPSNPSQTPLQNQPAYPYNMVPPYGATANYTNYPYYAYGNQYQYYPQPGTQYAWGQNYQYYNYYNAYQMARNPITPTEPTFRTNTGMAYTQNTEPKKNSAMDYLNSQAAGIKIQPASIKIFYLF